MKIINNIDYSINNILHNARINTFIYNINTTMKHDYNILKNKGIDVSIYEKIFNKLDNL